MYLSAQILAQALDGFRVGNGFMARCPAHEDSTPSLSIGEKAGKLLVHCPAGCGQVAVIRALADRGLWTPARDIPDYPNPRSYAPDHLAEAVDTKRRTAEALRTWCAAGAAAGTLVETYLKSRAIEIAPPFTVKFQDDLQHRSGASYPAMVALVTSGPDNRPLGIHRTFLARDGRGKAPVNPNKMMLGPCGGGAVRLAPATSRLMVGEGIETCLAAMQSTGYAAWAALSTSGFRALQLPAMVREVIILADGDARGEAASICAAARRKREGRLVRIARAPADADFADLLRA